MKLPKKSQVLMEAHEAIDHVVNMANDYVNQWTRYQALWDLQQDMLFERLGSDLSNWMKVVICVFHNCAFCFLDYYGDQEIACNGGFSGIKAPDFPFLH